MRRVLLCTLSVLLLLCHGQLSANNDIGFDNGDLFGVWQNINLLLGDMLARENHKIEFIPTAKPDATLEDLSIAIDLFELNVNRLQPSLNDFSPALREEFTNLSIEPSQLEQAQLYITSVKLLLQLAMFAKNNDEKLLIGPYFAVDEHSNVSVEQVYQQVIYAKQLLEQSKQNQIVLGETP